MKSQSYVEGQNNHTTLANLVAGLGLGQIGTRKTLDFKTHNNHINNISCVFLHLSS
jgi:hypothetical protein